MASTLASIAEEGSVVEDETDDFNGRTSASSEAAATGADAVVLLEPSESGLVVPSEIKGPRCSRHRRHEAKFAAAPSLDELGVHLPLRDRSVLYVMMAVEDHRWARELEDLPMWIWTADGDVSWVKC